MPLYAKVLNEYFSFVFTVEKDMKADINNRAVNGDS